MHTISIRWETILLYQLHLYLRCYWKDNLHVTYHVCPSSFSCFIQAWRILRCLKSFKYVWQSTWSNKKELNLFTRNHQRLAEPAKSSLNPRMLHFEAVFVVSPFPVAIKRIMDSRLYFLQEFYTMYNSLKDLLVMCRKDLINPIILLALFRMCG